MAGNADFFKNKLLTTLLFADGQVVLTASKDSPKKPLYQLYDGSSKYNLIISASKTKILAGFTGRPETSRCLI
jgi:hypothetical protein